LHKDGIHHSLFLAHRCHQRPSLHPSILPIQQEANTLLCGPV
jgi:hypothetical protein